MNGRALKVLSLVPIISIAVATLSIFLTSGCLEGGGSKELDLVIVSIAPQKELVERIAGPDIEVVVMVPENMDPHSYSPTPSKFLKAAKADIYFMIGSGIEFEELNMDTIRETNRGMRVVDLSEGIDIFSFEDHGIEHDHGGTGDEGDHEGTDPHIWLDPFNMLRMADTVAEAMISEDPDRMEAFIVNRDAYKDELNDLIIRINSTLGPFKGREFLTYHPSWGYFADAFDLLQTAVQEGGKEPGPQGISDLIDQARNSNITVVFVEPQFDSSSARQVAEAIGGEVVTVDPLAADYMKNLEDVVKKLSEGFNNG